MIAAGLKKGQDIRPVDEMRVGLQGQVRRVWASRGVKVIQRLQFVFEWTYLILAANPLTGAIQWQWITRMNQDQIKPVLHAWQLEGIVWDNASAHTAKATQQVDTLLVFQPPYSPELDPVERLFEELRKLIEGRNYRSLSAKQHAVERQLKEWHRHPETVKRLIGWAWFCEALETLPEPEPLIYDTS